MMKTIVLWALAGVLLPVVVLAQRHQFKVAAGEVPEKVIPYSERYRFQAFLKGKVYYTPDKTVPALLNYNTLQGTIYYINADGDTATVLNQYALKNVEIGNTLFRNGFTEGFFEVLTREGDFELAVRRRLLLVRKEYAGDNGYGVSPGAGTSYASGGVENSSHQVAADAFFTREITYALIDNNSRIYKANKASFLKLWARHRTKINRYLKEEAINFGREADLRKLLAFTGQL